MVENSAFVRERVDRKSFFFFHQRARKNKTHLTLESDKIVASNFSLYKGHDNKGQDKQLKKFSLSAPYEMYREQYGEYAY